MIVIKRFFFAEVTNYVLRPFACDLLAKNKQNLYFFTYLLFENQ